MTSLRDRTVWTWRCMTRSLILVVAIVTVNAAEGFAQLNGQNIKGDAGLKSGSQAPPGTYVAVPLYFYTADQIKDRDGKQLRTGNLDASVFGIALNVVTTRKIAGGTYAWLQSMGIEAGDWAVASGGTLDRRGDGRYLAVHRQP